MMWHYYDGTEFFWMGAVMLLVWAGILAVVIWAVRSFAHRPPASDPALETLRRRFVAGEITQEEFETSRRALQV